MKADLMLKNGEGYVVVNRFALTKDAGIGYSYPVPKDIQGLIDLLNDPDYADFVFDRCVRGLKLSKERAKVTNTPRTPDLPTIEQITFNLLKSGKFDSFAEAQKAAEQIIEEKKAEQSAVRLVGCKIDRAEAAKLDAIAKQIADSFATSGSIPDDTTYDVDV